MWFLIACGPRPMPTCTISEADPGRLRVEGREIRDEDDRLVTLRGVNAGGRSKFAPYRPYDQDLEAYLDRPEAWGFSVLRVPFSWAAAEPERGVWDEDWMAEYDALLDGAWQRGIYTIVDFHQDVYTEAWCGDGFPAWTLPEDPGEPRHDCPNWFTGYSTDERVDAAFEDFFADTYGARTDWEAMWDVMIARHEDRPGVIGFELMNEPHADDEVLSAFYQDQVDRLEGDALIFLDTSGTDGINAATGAEPPDCDRCVFAPHHYTPQALFGGPLGDVTPFVEAWAATGEDWEMPVLLGEFGVRADHGSAIPAYLEGYYQAFDATGMHATFWEYSDAAELWNEEDLSLVGPDGAEREDMLEAVVRPFVVAQPGVGEWSVTDGVLSVALEVVEGSVTEISLPGGGMLIGEGGCVESAGSRVRIEATDERLEFEATPGS